MSMMLLEAICQGAPAVASDIPENTSILPPGFATFRCGDPGSLAAALRAAFAADEEGRRAAAGEARAWVSSRYRWEAITARYAEVYREALERRPRRQG